MRVRALLAWAVVFGFLLQSVVASPVYADHETRFAGPAEGALDVGLIAWTVAGAILGFAALIAVVLFWERRDEEGARRAQEQADREGIGED